MDIGRGIGMDAEAFNRALGARVREARRTARLTRRQLSEQARVSERYIGQLESGEANVSIGLFLRVAEALGRSPHRLLPPDGAGHAADAVAFRPLANLLAAMSGHEQAQAYEVLKRLRAERPRPKGLALVGLRGAGKSTLGRAVAERFGVPFLRLSRVIEELAGMRVGDLINLRGAAAYRRFEAAALEHIMARHARSVVETAGGIVHNADAYRLLLARYGTVWIKASPEEHMQRVTAQGDLRPMAGHEQAMEDLRAILAEREPAYGQARAVLDTSGRSVGDCLAELERLAAPFLGAETAEPHEPGPSPGLPE